MNLLALVRKRREVSKLSYCLHTMTYIIISFINVFLSLRKVKRELWSNSPANSSVFFKKNFLENRIQFQEIGN